MSNRKPTRGIAVAGTRIWLDVSTHSVVLVCDVCDWQEIAFSNAESRSMGEQHMKRHPGVETWTQPYASTQQPCRWDDECTDPHYGHGMCRRHRARVVYAEKQTDPNASRCVVDGCSKVAHRKAMCQSHYKQARAAA